MKFIASDLDGTFLNDAKQYDAALFDDVLNELAAKKERFVIATGRELKWIQYVFGSFAKRVDIVASNGAVIQPMGATVMRTQISANTLSDLQQFLEAHQAVPTGGLRTYTDNEMYLVNGMGRLDSETYRFMEKLYDEIVNVDSLAEVNQSVSSVTGRWEKNRDEGQRIMQAINDSELPLFATTSGYGTVDILPAGVNKAVALEKLMNQITQDDHELVAFGDGMNDYEMLKLADEGFVMPNGSSFLLAQPEFKHVEQDNNHSGVLKTIQAWK